MVVAVGAERTRLRELTAALKKNLEACGVDPEVEAVHNVRTGTRRIEAMLETIVRELGPQNAPVAGEENAIAEAAGNDHVVHVTVEVGFDGSQHF